MGRNRAQDISSWRKASAAQRGLSYLFKRLAGVPSLVQFLSWSGPEVGVHHLVHAVLKRVDNDDTSTRARCIHGLKRVDSCNVGVLHFTAGFLSSQGPELPAGMPREISGVFGRWEMVHS